MRRFREPRPLLAAAKWIGTAAGIAGAVLIALNLGVVVYGFMLFLVSSLLWSAIGWIHREPSLLLLQVAFTLTTGIHPTNVALAARHMLPSGGRGPHRNLQTRLRQPFGT